ncbi:MAG TPA: hypothetical protein IAC72_03810 [Candidatus Fimimonas merdipullorum]|uniref:Uncharacterized protein n=1 Tax=Candidatus Fimimonas merdipullorum TaxID=2840822 RepID=A0A9D1MXJ8_9BACT|nr:hypothetical protein [Candidatus Fimimonas merdipullorum]
MTTELQLKERPLLPLRFAKMPCPNERRLRPFTFCANAFVFEAFIFAPVSLRSFARFLTPFASVKLPHCYKKPNTYAKNNACKSRRQKNCYSAEAV